MGSMQDSRPSPTTNRPLSSPVFVTIQLEHNTLLKTNTFLQLTNILPTDRENIKRKQSSTSVFFPSTCNLLCYYCCCYHCYCHPKYLNNPARIKLSSTSLLLVFFSSKRLLCKMSSSSGDA